LADFKLGVAGSESSLPTCVVDELPCESADSFVGAEMADGSLRYNAKTKSPRTWTLEWDQLTSAECDTLDTIAALKTMLNYINGYQGLAAGANVICANWTGRVLKVPTSGLTTPRYRGTMTLKEVC